MTIFLTSDTHFGHSRIIDLCDRPYSTIEEMDEALIRNWNRVVGPRDEVFHLGDFAYRTEDMAKYFDRLNGRKRLIIGNHDDDETFKLGWASQSSYAEIKINKRKVILFHYPVSEWNGYHRGAIHAHGHQHNKNFRTGKRRFDVGVDANSFAPVAIDALIEDVLRYERDGV